MKPRGLPKRAHWILLVCSLFVLSSFYRFRPGIEDTIVGSSSNSDFVVPRDPIEASAAVVSEPPTPPTRVREEAIPPSGDGLQPLETFDIPVHNASSYVSSDVSRIVHVPAESRIEVHLHPNRRCRNPVFWGRISGWSLSMIEFDVTPIATTSSSDVIVGTYDRSQMPVSGNYYVEIILVLCESYGSGFRTVNLKTTCLEDTVGANHRITNATSAIDIVVDSSAAATGSSGGGRWLHKSFLLGDPNLYPKAVSQQILSTTKLLPPEPLHTRYQPQECVVDTNFKQSLKTPYCKAAVDHKPIKQYHYRWDQGGPNEVLNEPVFGKLLQENNNTTNDSDEVLELKEDINVCWVGASHSRVFNWHCKVLLEEHEDSKDNQRRVLPLDTDHFQCSHSNFKTIGKISDEWVTENVIGKDCTHAVVGLFQFPFSFHQVEKNSTTWTFDEWKAEMIHNVGNLERFVKRTDNPLKKILLRSAHTNGLKSHVTQCPPYDLRTPPNAHVATTTILPELADHFSSVVALVNVDFLIAPVWDRPKDWSHYHSEAGMMETKFILSEIWKEELRNS